MSFNVFLYIAVPSEKCILMYAVSNNMGTAQPSIHLFYWLNAERKLFHPSTLDGVKTLL